jgi:outer membrane protein assembly factor BamB
LGRTVRHGKTRTATGEDFESSPSLQTLPVFAILQAPVALNGALQMDANQLSHGNDTRWVRRLRRALLVAVVLLWLLGIAAIVWVNADERWGSGMRLSVMAATIAFGGLSTWLWFVTLSPVRRRIRFGVAIVSVAIVAILASVFRLDEVTGGMWPRFVVRWAPKADRMLGPLPSARSETSPDVDLSVTSPDDYPRFLGVDQRQSIDGVQFDTNWSATPPRCVWRQPVGAGWSSFVAVNGFAITQEQRDDQELVTCYEIASGQLVWANGIEARHETVMGGTGPRATPCVDGGRVYSLGATGVLRCLDGATGLELWHHDVLRETGVRNDLKAIAWGRAGSPLIVDDTVVIPVGGPANDRKISLVAYDKLTGKEVWKAGNRQISYASPVRSHLLGHDQILIALEDQVASFDSQTGRPLWEHAWPGHSNGDATVSNALPLSPNRVFLSKGYGQGAELIQLSVAAHDQWHTETRWKSPVLMKTKFSNVVAFDGHIYGLDDVVLECIEIESGRRRWKRGRFGYGQLVRAGNVLIVLSETGELAAVEATPEAYIEHGRFDALQGKCWNNPCLYGPYLLVRNGSEAACYELPGWSRDSSTMMTFPTRDNPSLVATPAN